MFHLRTAIKPDTAHVMVFFDSKGEFLYNPPLEKQALIKSRIVGFISAYAKSIRR